MYLRYPRSLSSSVGADLELDAFVKVFRVLPDDGDVDPLGARGNAWEQAARPDARVEIEFLPQGHVDRPESGADRRRDGALERNPITP